MSPNKNCGGRLLDRRMGVKKRINLPPLGFEIQQKDVIRLCYLGPKNIVTGKSSDYRLDLPKTVFLYE
jgi:hypothetical protein